MTEVVWKGADQLRDYLVPVAELKPHPENPMRGAHHVLVLANSLAAFGQVRPIVTWENAEDFGFKANTIIGGHHVWRGAQLENLAWTHVAAMPARFGSPEEALAYLVVDNATAQREAKEFQDQLGLFNDYAKHVVGEEEFQKYVNAAAHSTTLEDLGTLKIHERSTRKDPVELLEHVKKQLEEIGFTEEVVVARDGTILSGEMVFKAAAELGLSQVPVRRVDVDPDSPEALRIMAMSYTSGKQAMVDDRAFAELLKNIKDDLGSLEGTGYDADMLAGLLIATRTAAEIRDAHTALEWVGLSEYASVPLPVKLIVSFDTELEREEFMLKNDMVSMKSTLSTISVWWPHKDRADPASLRFVDSSREQKSAV